MSSEAIVLRVDVENLPAAKAKERLEEYRFHIKELFPGHKVVVIPSTFDIQFVKLDN
jgi:hypothetical protein